MSKDEKKGWFGSIVVHLLIALVLFLMKVEETRTEPEFIEVSWGNISNISIKAAPSLPASSSSASSSPASSSAKPVQGKAVTQRSPVQLPERTPGFKEQDPPLPVARKSIVEEQYQPGSARRTESADGSKKTGSGLGNGDGRLAANGAGVGGKTPGAGLSGGDGSDEGKTVGYSMQWGDGGKRRLLVGDLPAYPDGVNVEAQIRIEAVVTPGGNVRSMRPVQKGNTRLEESAMSEVKGWLFEPLPRNSKQSDQTCLITFNFVLR